MEFRPCIDIHNGLVKQIVGSSLQDEGDVAQENFVSKRNADFFAKFYAKDGLKGGHVIMLNRPDSPYDETAGAAGAGRLSRRAADRGRHHGGECQGVSRGGSQPCDCDILCLF